MASAEAWNTRAARIIRHHCHHDHEPTKPRIMARNLKWWRYRLQVKGDSPERIEAAIRGLPLVIPAAAGRQWDPVLAFSKRGPWVDLFERCVTAEGKSRATRPDVTPQFRDCFKALAAAL